MTRWIRTALLTTAVAMGVLLPAGAALADGPAVDPNGGTLTWQLPTTD
ncbi:hypothetical protein QRX60_08725 [Amycolatopsis mongoliensis]|jgi:hypothetical protein|uniref:Uncharacterized protein n=1 Tax=Amycolatopsis mongoliensis TaxID=715475 RepID=A0A9Y2JVW0_9PSEU|nr:hypothetical protein [Amycolatopsis sp. 4-36]WIY03919.1 hypothetical protein QRX60_08725 [Amycolatopsis sp. 4-36]